MSTYVAVSLFCLQPAILLIHITKMTNHGELSSQQVQGMRGPSHGEKISLEWTTTAPRAMHFTARPAHNEPAALRNSHQFFDCPFFPRYGAAGRLLSCAALGSLRAGGWLACASSSRYTRRPPAFSPVSTNCGAWVVRQDMRADRCAVKLTNVRKKPRLGYRKHFDLIVQPCCCNIDPA